MACNSVPIHTIAHLFWKKYSYSVEIDFATASISENTNPRFHGYQKSHRQLGDDIKALISSDKTIAKLVRTYNIWKVYFANGSDQDEFLLALQQLTTNEFKIVGIWQPESIEHLELLKQDHKLVTRDSLFYLKYTWKITFEVAYKLENQNELVAWIQDMYVTDDVTHSTADHPTHSSSRYRFSEGKNTPVLYLADDDDVVIAKLVYSPSIKKIEKAVILNQNNNNNNKGNTNEPSTVSQIG